MSKKWIACALAFCMLMTPFAGALAPLRALAEEEIVVAEVIPEPVNEPAPEPKPEPQPEPQPEPEPAPEPIPQPEPEPVAPAAVEEQPVDDPIPEAAEQPEEQPAEPAADEAEEPAEPEETIESEGLIEGEEIIEDEEPVENEEPVESEELIGSEELTEDEAAVPSEEELTIEELPIIKPEEPELPDEDYGEGPVYVLENGIRHFGEPESLIPLDKPIYLYNYLIIEINGYSIERLKNVRFVLGGGFAADDVIYLSKRDPNGRVKEDVVFLWAGPEQPSMENNADRLGDVIDATEDEYLEMEIMVQAENYTADAPCLPTFRLTAIPEAQDGMVFAVSINDGAPLLLTEGSVSPAEDGEYRFLLLSENGEELARSNKYRVQIAVPSDEDVEEEEEVLTEVELFAPIPVEPELPEEETDLPEAEELPQIQLPEEGEDEVHMEFLPVEELPAESEEQPDVTDENDLVTEDLLVEDVPEEEFFFTVEEDVLLEEIAPLYEAIEVIEVPVFETLLSPEDAPLYNDTLEGDISGAISVVELVVEQIGQTRFHLSGLPEDGEHVYTVQLNDGEPVILLDSSYTAPQNGDYLFAIRDADNMVAASSQLFTVDALTDPIELPEHFGFTVTTDYGNGKWTNKAPVFTLGLEGIDALPEGCSFAVIAEGEAVSALSDASVIDVFKETTYAFKLEGVHKIQFALVDVANDQLLALHGSTFEIKLDTLAPVVIATALDGYAVRVVVGDQLSSAKAVYISTDGGNTWTKSSGLQDLGQGISSSDESILPANESIKAVEFVASKAIVLPANKSIKAVDEAGNETLYNKDVTLFSLKNQQNQMMGAMSGFGGFGGFGGRSGGKYRSVSHSESDVDDVTAYNAVRLIVDDGSMHTLCVGDEQLDLQLLRDDFLVTGQDNAASASFTASFAAWNGQSGVDTLILSASDPRQALETGLYTWSFSGVVYKKLAASGIDNLVLRVGDQATVLSTAGFSAGIRYSMYRAQGLPSKEFHYDVRMGMPASSFEMDVTVGGETYRMTSDPEAEFYYYDVYHGSAALFGVLSEG